MYCTGYFLLGGLVWFPYFYERERVAAARYIFTQINLSCLGVHLDLVVAALVWGVTIV